MRRPLSNEPTAEDQGKDLTNEEAQQMLENTLNPTEQESAIPKDPEEEPAAEEQEEEQKGQVEEEEEEKEGGEEKPKEKESKEEEKEHTPEDEAAEIRKNMMALMSGGTLPVDEPSEESSAPVPPQEEEGKEVKGATKPQDFVTAEEWKEVEEKGLTREILNKWLKRAGTGSDENTFRKVVPVVENLVRHQVQLHGFVSDFYRDNQDLSTFKPVVSAVVLNLQKKHPEWTYEKLFSELGGEVRKALRLNVQQGKDKKQSPAFANPPNAGGGNQKPPKKSSLQSELDELKP